MFQTCAYLATSFGDRPYYAFKKQLTGPDSYPKQSIETVAEIVDRVLDEYGISA